MNIVEYKKIASSGDYKYSLKFIPNPKVKNAFLEFSRLLSVADTMYDVNSRSWLVTDEGLEYFIDLNERLAPKSSYEKMKEKMQNIIENDVKNITDYDDIGKNMKLSPYDYQKEIIKFILDTHEVLVVAPCGSGKIICRS